MGGRDSSSHRQTERNAKKTAERVEQYHGIVALLRTWESQPDDVQADNHDYIIALKRRERNVKNYIMHRAGPDSDL